LAVFSHLRKRWLRLTHFSLIFQSHKEDSVCRGLFYFGVLSVVNSALKQVHGEFAGLSTRRDESMEVALEREATTSGEGLGGEPIATSQETGMKVESGGQITLCLKNWSEILALQSALSQLLGQVCMFIEDILILFSISNWEVYLL